MGGPIETLGLRRPECQWRPDGASPRLLGVRDGPREEQVASAFKPIGRWRCVRAHRDSLRLPECAAAASTPARRLAPAKLHGNAGPEHVTESSSWRLTRCSQSDQVRLVINQARRIS